MEATLQTQTQDQTQLLTELMSKVKESKKQRSSKEPDWYVQREFYRGNQYVSWVRDMGGIGGKLETLPNARRKPRLINNICRPQVETLLAYLLRQEPVFGCVAKSGEPEDQNAAMTARSILYHYWTLLNCGERIELAGLFTLNMGASFWKVGWDASAGPKVPIIERQPAPPTPEDLMATMQGLPVEPRFVDVQVGEQPAGEVRIDSLSPFEFLPDPGAQTLEDCQWAIHQTMRPVSEMKALYPEHAEKIVASDPDDAAWEKQALQKYGKPGQSSKDKLARIQVFEYWHRKCAEYPEGRRVVFIKGLVLEDGATPPGYDDMPFAMWPDRLIPGEFWPDATLRDVVPLQKEHNAALSQWADIRRKFRTVWTAPVGSITEEQINDEDGQVIEHAPGQPPQAHAPPDLPSTLFEMLKFTPDASQNATGAAAVLQGGSTGEVRSGRQVAYQGQYAEGRIGLLAKHLARFLERVGKLILMMVEANVTEQRIARVVGKNRSIEVKNFKGADIRGNTDVIVDPGTLLSFSKSERFNMLKDMLQNQVIDPQKFLELMEMSDFQGALEGVAQDRNNAQRENESWKQGMQVEPAAPWDDHKVHLSNHNYFRKSDAYRMLPPEMRMVVNQHCAFHEKMLIQAQMGPMPAGGPPNEGPAGIGAPEAPQPKNGMPPTPGEMQQYVDKALSQSGQELAEGLPPVPPIADAGPENQH